MSLDVSDKIYTERKMVIGVLLGGALAGGYYFWRTFNALGMPRRAMAAVVIALIVLALTLGSIFIPALDRVPNIAFYGLQAGLTIGAIRAYLSTDIDAHVNAGRPEYGWGNTILVAVISVTLTLGPLIGLAYLSPDTFEDTTTRYYGELKHEIVFDPANVSEAEVERVASALTSTGFFDDEVQKTVDVEKSDRRFIITVYCNEGARTPEWIDFYKEFRSDLQKSFPANPIVIDMVVGTPDNRIARLE